jgi:hypothetical protein
MSQMPLLAPWANFYVMTGGAAAALVGLMFVVITLVTGEERVSKSPDGISTFSTPTVLFFSTALLVSAVLSAPWHSLTGPAIIIGMLGGWGVLYLCRITYRAGRLQTYKPDLEDWTYYTVLPFIAYAVLLVAAIVLHTHPASILFAFAAGVLLLIFLGIRNAWDVVTYLAIGQPADIPSDDKPET